MFGYVKPVRGELLVREDEFYRAVYCGICRGMKRHTGELSRVTLSYDSVFLALVRMLYIPDVDFGVEMRRCVAHPLKKRGMLKENSAIEYTARAFAVLTYYKMQDDLCDEGALRRFALSCAAPVGASAMKNADMPTLSLIASEKLLQIRALEEAKDPSVDKSANLFGELLGEIFAHGLAEDQRLVPYRLGYHLGRFILAADAAEDYEKDRASGAYNPYCILYGAADLTDENRESIRCALILECQKIEAAANLLPYGSRATIENIINNIIYLGLVKRIEFLSPKQKESEKTS